MTLFYKKKSFILTCLVAVFLLSGCKDVEVSGFDACIKTVEMKIRQGDKRQTTEVSVQNGIASLEIGSDINPANAVQIEMKVKSVHNKPECQERKEQIKAENYRFKGRLPAPEDGYRDINLREHITQTTPVTPAGGGKVEGGTAPIPPEEPRGDGEIAITIWAENIPNCRKICWEQWAKGSIYIKNANDADFREIRKGDRYRSGTTMHRYGHFGRDLPVGETGHCIVQYDVPNKSRQKGILDAPGLENEDEQFRNGLYRMALIHGGADTDRGKKFKLRYDFEVYSLLVCEDPTPKKTIGRFHWKVEQLWELVTGAPVVLSSLKYKVIQRPIWTNGKTNPDLPDEIDAP